jgi:hypothetical protein
MSKARLGQYLERMQGLGKKEAGLVATGVDGTVEAADGNERLTGKIF